eukprot:2138495-Alexandrium_andersonii.AAC.1
MEASWSSSTFLPAAILEKGMPSHVSGSGVGSSQTARAREATRSAWTPVDELAARALATGTT